MLLAFLNLDHLLFSFLESAEVILDKERSIELANCHIVISWKQHISLCTWLKRGKTNDNSFHAQNVTSTIIYSIPTATLRCRHTLSIYFVHLVERCLFFQHQGTPAVWLDLPCDSQPLFHVFCNFLHLVTANYRNLASFVTICTEHFASLKVLLSWYFTLIFVPIWHLLLSPPSITHTQQYKNKISGH